MSLYQKYLQLCATSSDIQHHLPLLYSYARGNVVELGTRGGVSTAALLAGVERRGGFVLSVDIDKACADLYAGHTQWEFLHGSSTNIETFTVAMGRLPNRDDGGLSVLFIDTEHTYEQASRELEIWARCVRPGGVILMHDPETFPGVRRAATEFAEAKGWLITFVLPNNGMAVIEVPHVQ